LATLILKKYGNNITSVKLIPSSGGVFEVFKEQQLVFSKKNENRFPEDDEIIEKLENI